MNSTERRGGPRFFLSFPQSLQSYARQFPEKSNNYSHLEISRISAGFWVGTGETDSMGFTRHRTGRARERSLPIFAPLRPEVPPARFPVLFQRHPSATRADARLEVVWIDVPLSGLCSQPVSFAHIWARPVMQTLARSGIGRWSVFCPWNDAPHRRDALRGVAPCSAAIRRGGAADVHPGR